MGFVAIVIIVRIICAVIAMFIAKSKGRSQVGWFFGGLALELIGVIIIACMSNLKEQQNYRNMAAVENQRLREQIRQERIKQESFQQHALTRLDAHDNHLGVDTRSIASLPDQSGGSPGLLVGPSTENGLGNPQYNLHQADKLLWYYEVGGATKDPIDETRIIEKIRMGEIGKDTLLWAEGMADWVQAHAVPSFQVYFS